MEAVTREHVSETYHREVQQKQVWRIGSFSMGVTLIGIGIAFAMSLWQETSAYELLLWLAPVVFILLGGELLLTMRLSHHQKYQMKYDWLSLWFVSIISVGALIMSVLFYTGITDELNQAFNMKERSLFVDEKVAIAQDQFSKIVVKGNVPVTIAEHEGLTDVLLTGSITYEAKDAVTLRDQQLLQTKQVGDVLYVFVNNIEHEVSGLVTDRVFSNLILSVPAGSVIES
ncbi:hypothetical protein [Paenibacillus endoradicis]|uniref:hypothetical protein n=1 Tax=Paenibacillus endoradicis TaxID=2972487 RepID=UPI00215988DC|nr:hypothetical protein [Paenibacillus endoradicis]MCR8658898.1 hypothetical protein [Paenibacillus endoradicis]